MDIKKINKDILNLLLKGKKISGVVEYDRTYLVLENAAMFVTLKNEDVYLKPELMFSSEHDPKTFKSIFDKVGGRIYPSGELREQNEKTLIKIGNKWVNKKFIQVFKDCDFYEHSHGVIVKNNTDEFVGYVFEVKVNETNQKA